MNWLIKKYELEFPSLSGRGDLKKEKTNFFPRKKSYFSPTLSKSTMVVAGRLCQKLFVSLKMAKNWLKLRFPFAIFHHLHQLLAHFGWIIWLVLFQNIVLINFWYHCSTPSYRTGFITVPVLYFFVYPCPYGLNYRADYNRAFPK